MAPRRRGKRVPRNARIGRRCPTAPEAQIGDRDRRRRSWPESIARVESALDAIRPAAEPRRRSLSVMSPRHQAALRSADLDASGDEL